uniref:G protein-coupled receptor n=1 Tax=Acrobeloides nanus TaxID=290746 RepID=A0A914DJG7_9BILA
MITVNYIIIVVCTYKIWHHMKSVSSLVGERTREVQTQLTHTLLYQTISPIISIFIPFLILVIPTIAQLDVSILAIVSVTLMPWVPAINSLMTMWIIKPYRTAIKRIFSKASTTYTTGGVTIKGVTSKA